MKQVDAPIIPVELDTVGLISIESGQSIDAVHCENNVFSGLEAKNVSIDASVFEAVELSSCKLKRANLSDVRLDNCLLFGTDFDGSGWRRVAVKGGMHSGLVMSDTSLEDVSFDAAKLNLANFRVAKLKNVIFKNCDLSEADFSGSTMKSVYFKNCNLTQVNFGNCTLSDVDLRSSDISSVKGVTGLKGAKIDLSQLISITQTMAAELGLIIEA